MDVVIHYKASQRRDAGNGEDCFSSRQKSPGLEHVLIACAGNSRSRIGDVLVEPLQQLLQRIDRLIGYRLLAFGSDINRILPACNFPPNLHERGWGWRAVASGRR